jgi:hypothetical protein
MLSTKADNGIFTLQYEARARLLRIKAPRSSKNESAIRRTIKAKADGAKAFINAICIDDSEPSEILAASAKLYGRKLVVQMKL